MSPCNSSLWHRPNYLCIATRHLLHRRRFRHPDDEKKEADLRRRLSLCHGAGPNPNSGTMMPEPTSSHIKQLITLRSSAPEP
jgi:hypothetical protein